MRAFIDLGLRLMLATAWFVCHATHCGLDWAHHLPVVHDELRAIWPALTTYEAILAALAATTLMTVLDIANARSIASLGCTSMHALNITIGWAVIAPEFGAWLHALAPLMGEPVTAIAVLATASVATVLEYIHTIRHAMRVWLGEGDPDSTTDAES